MFRTLIYASPGACDYSVELSHWSYCSWFDVCWNFGVVGLEWYPCCRLLQPATRIPLQTNHTENPTHIEPRAIRNTDTTPNLPHRTSKTHRTKNNTTYVVIKQNSRKLLMMDILMSETFWAHKKWNKIASDIKLVFHSIVTMMHGPINIRFWHSFISYIRGMFRPTIWDIIRRYDKNMNDKTDITKEETSPWQRQPNHIKSVETETFEGVRGHKT